jgi:hypothetical protein
LDVDTKVVQQDEKLFVLCVEAEALLQRRGSGALLPQIGYLHIRIY